MMFDEHVGTVAGIPPLLNNVLKLTNFFSKCDRQDIWVDKQADRQTDTDCQMGTTSITTIQC